MNKYGNYNLAFYYKTVRHSLVNSMTIKLHWRLYTVDNTILFYRPWLNQGKKNQTMTVYCILIMKLSWIESNAYSCVISVNHMLFDRATPRVCD